MKDFFISYNSKDRQWAEWIAWTLEEASYQVVIQAWDFRPGANFVLDMHKAAEGTVKTIAVLSDHYLNAEYTHPEWAAAFAKDPQGFERKLVPVRVAECTPTGLLQALVYVDLVGLGEEDARTALLGAFSERGKPISPPSFPATGTVAAASPAKRLIAERKAYPGAAGRGTTSALEVWFSEQWPRTEPVLFGRGGEVDLLDAAWESEGTRIVSFVASGGVGKTALVNGWIYGIEAREGAAARRGMNDDDWRGAERVFAWSFYSQGAEEGRQASGDEFLRQALAWFGDPDMAESNAAAREKGDRLAALVRERRTLLLLDGLEPLQEPTGSPTGRDGALRDPGVAALLRGLAHAPWRGLCVVTTRLRIDDLRMFERRIEYPQVAQITQTAQSADDPLQACGCVPCDSSDVGTRLPDRGREDALGCAPPPSEPDVRISRIRLSSWWFTAERVSRP